jgi:hypothetical protein
MNETNLKKKAEELEQTLAKQLEVLKTDYQLWVKLGGTVLLSGIAAFALVRVIKGDKNKKLKKALRELEKEGILNRGRENQVQFQPLSYSKPSFWAPVGQRILMAAFDFGKDRIFAEIAKKLEGKDDKAYHAAEQARQEYPREDSTNNPG